MAEFNFFYATLIFIPVLFAVALFFLSRNKKKKKSKAFFFLWNTSLTLLLVSSLFVGFETYYRFYADYTDSFGLNKMTVRWFARHYKMNNVGMRDNIDYQLPRSKAKKHRITFLGDSFTAGQGIKNVDDRFVNIIRKDNPDWDVQCLAVNGLCSNQELDFLNGISSHGYEFDYVVLCYVLNDMADLLPEQQAFQQKVYTDYVDELSYLDTASYFMNTIHWRIKELTDTDLTNYYSFAKRGYEGPEWNKHKATLTQIVNTVQSKGGKILVVTFPFLNNMGKGTYEFSSVHTQLDNFWDTSHVPNLDLLSLYKPYQPDKIMVGKYDAHPNEFAHQLAAKSIEDFINRNMAAATPN